ncbi:MAG: hypothetical protein AAF533_24085, partial [Acidobacteriota bacterium]
MHLSSFLAGALLFGGLAASSSQALQFGSIAWDREGRGALPVAIHDLGDELTVVEEVDLGEGHLDLGWSELTADGTLLREVRFGLGNASRVRSSVITRNGDLVVAWYERDRGLSRPLGEIHVASFDAERELRWSWSYSAAADWFPVLLELPDGELLVAARVYPSLVLIRLSAEDGSVSSARQYDVRLAPIAAVVTPAGRVMLSGGESGRIGLMELSSELDVSWYRNYYTTSSRYHPRHMSLRAGGGLLMAGSADDEAFGQGDGWTLAVDSSGDIEWQLVHGTAQIEDIWTAIQLPDGGWV